MALALQAVVLAEAGMWIDYSMSIAESVAELQARERAVRGQRAASKYAEAMPSDH